MPEAVPGAGGAGQMPEAASTRWKAPRRLMKWGAGIQEVGIPEGNIWGHSSSFRPAIYLSSATSLILVGV